MNSFFKHHARFTAFLASLVLFIFQGVHLSAATFEEDVSSGEYLYLKGLVHSVSIAESSLKVEQRDGSRITIRIAPETEFEGAGNLEDLQARQTIKIWYRPDPDGNTGLKILRMPDLGC